MVYLWYIVGILNMDLVYKEHGNGTLAKVPRDVFFLLYIKTIRNSLYVESQEI